MTARIVTTALVCLAMVLVSACSSPETSESPPITCAGIATLCGATCVVTASDPRNCGACGNACSAGEVCVEGACASACPEGQVECDGTCVSPESDPNHCGASGDCRGGNAGWMCGPGDRCVDGECATTCPSGQIACDGVCLSPATDRNHCGATADCTGADAGVVCEPGDQCVDGACRLVCPAGRIACDDTCVSPGTSLHFCGASGDCLGENAGAECSAGEVCREGACGPPCAEGLITCGDSCVDPSSDRVHCGASGDCLEENRGVVCGQNQACVDGACLRLKCESNAECEDGSFCNGVEACDPEDPQSDDFGCRPGQKPCFAWEVCSEASRSCMGP